ncbi:hypothetical protein [Natrinema versiforme]|uniref:Uncharacterized protein n=1 Tax=Natrinema versiforme JCM 10478 TaxID=1227496 RepID=L9XWV6_9EURY|nr:hypothetical protein [Natrinema versiforme]ELY65911.1 hypothetical protein C489_13658 [Natrinema versiforme JCM 10478]
MPPPAQPVPIGLEDRLLAFAVSLLIGGAALHAGTHVVADARDYAHAVLTALLGALAWIAVVKWRYRLGWLRSLGVSAAAWAAAVVVLAALELLGIGSVSALGVPGT